MGLFEDRLEEMNQAVILAQAEHQQALRELKRMHWVGSVKRGDTVALKALKAGPIKWDRRVCKVVAIRRSRKCSSGLEIKVDDGEGWRDSGWFERPAINL